MACQTLFNIVFIIAVIKVKLYLLFCKASGRMPLCQDSRTTV